MDSPDDNWFLERIGLDHSNFTLDKCKDVIKVGRDSRTNDKVFIRGNTVSRQHLKLQRIGSEEDYRWTVTDNGSSNGTFINQERIPPHQEVELKHGDILGIGAQEDSSRVSKDVVFMKESFVFRVVAPRTKTTELDAIARKKTPNSEKVKTPSPSEKVSTPSSTKRRPQDLPSERVWTTIEPKRLNSIQDENEPTTPKNRSTPKYTGKVVKTGTYENQFQKLEGREISFAQKSFDEEDTVNGYNSS